MLVLRPGVGRGLRGARRRFHALAGLPPDLAARAASLLGPDARPTEVQREAVPELCERWRAGAGRDVSMLRAHTGQGKTLAYVLPLLARLGGVPRRRGTRGPRAVVLVPTPEVGLQVAGAVQAAAGALGEGEDARAVMQGRAAADAEADTALVQVRCARGAAGPGGDCEVMVATPRVAADLLLEGRGARGLGGVEVLVADEAEVTLRPASRRLHQKARELRKARPKAGRRLLVGLWRASPGTPALLVSATASATLRNEAHQAMRQSGTENPPHVDVIGGAAGVPPGIRHAVVPVGRAEGRAAAAAALFRAEGMGRALALVDDREGVAATVERLREAGLRAAALHSLPHMGAKERRRAEADAEVLVAAERACRGVHLHALGHVLMLSPATSSPAYAHAAGRTGRLGAPGSVWALLTADEEPRHRRRVERLRVELQTRPLLK